jgi:hypothetical protein
VVFTHLDPYSLGWTKAHYKEEYFMDIASIGVYHNNAQTKSEIIKPASANEQTEVTAPKANEVVTDSFTKSAAAEAISTQDAVASTEQTTQATANSTSLSIKGADTKMPPNKSVIATNSNTDDAALSTTAVSAESTTDSTAAVTTISEYTTAELAEYDLNGDGKLDAQEEAKMKAAQAKEAAQEAAVSTNQQEDPEEGLSIDQIEAKESYEIAKKQLLSSDDEPVIDELI